MSEALTQTEHPLKILGRELAETRDKLVFWRVLTVVTGFLALFLGVGGGFALFIGFHQAEDLAAYRDRCIDISTAALLTESTTKVNDINELCLESHQRHMSILKEALPGLFIDQDRITPYGLFAKGGGKKDDRKRKRKPKRKKVSEVPNGKGGHSVLPSQKPK